MEPYVSDDAIVLQFLFEDGVPVAEPAFGIGKFEHFAGGDDNSFYLIDGVFHFHAVCADILDRSAANQSRYCRKVLYTI